MSRNDHNPRWVFERGMTGILLFFRGSVVKVVEEVAVVVRDLWTLALAGAYYSSDTAFRRHNKGRNRQSDLQPEDAARGLNYLHRAGVVHGYLNGVRRPFNGLPNSQGKRVTPTY